MTDRKVRSYTIICITIALLFASSCGSKTEVQTMSSENLAVEHETQAVDDQPVKEADVGPYYYDVSYLPVDNALVNAEYMAVGDGLVCLKDNTVYWADTSGTKFLKPSPIELGDVDVMCWWADSEKIYIAYGSLRYEDNPEGGRYRIYDDPILRVLLHSGEILSETALPVLVDYGSYCSVIPLGEYIYAGVGQYIVRITDGEISQISIGDCFNPDSYSYNLALVSLFPSSDGHLLSVIQKDYDNHLYSIDYELGVIGALLVETKSNDFTWFYAGSDYGYDVYITSSGENSLRAYNYGDEGVTTLFDYSECSTVFNNLKPDSPVCVGKDVWLFSAYSSGARFVPVITKIPGEKPEEAEKKIITVGGIYADLDGVDISGQALIFNITHPEYEIVIKEYKDDYPATSSGWDDAITAINLDFLTGEAPDVFLFDDKDWKSVGDKGGLVDLYQLMDNDDSFDRDDLFENILTAGEIDGGLYVVPSVFTISALVGPSEILGDISGWTLDEFLQFGESLPEGVELIWPGELYYERSWYLQTGYTSWIDGSTCHFDDGSFADILEYLNSLTYEWDDYVTAQWARLNGDIVLGQSTIYQMYKYSYDIQLCGGDVTYVGYPLPDRAGVSASFGTGIGISAASEYQDMAWEFVKQLMSSQSENWTYYKLPIQKSRFLQALEVHMQAETYNDYYVYLEDELMYTPKPLTQPQADYLYELVDEIKCVDTDTNIIAIIGEETESFFAGQKTADEVAQLIQGRVSIYLSERE